MADPRVAQLLPPGTRRLVRTVDAMADEDWAAASLLPGWTRADVVAHLTLNAEGLSAAIEGVHEGREIALYPSPERRDGDIAALAQEPPTVIRERFLASTTVLNDWLEELAPNLEPIPIERTPGGPTFLAGEAGERRVREVEIHHADLGAGYSAADWEPAFVALLLDARRAAYGDGPAFTAYAVDLDQSWAFGPGDATGSTTVSGPSTDLAWWSTGRGSGEGLTSDGGVMPQIGAW